MARTTLTGSHEPGRRTHRGVLTGVAFTMAAASLAVAQPAAANYPPPPGGSVTSQAHLNEVAPSQCPGWAPAGSLRAGQRAAAVMSLVQSAKLNGHDPWAYLKDVLERLLAHPNNRIDELLPHRWEPKQETSA